MNFALMSNAANRGRTRHSKEGAKFGPDPWWTNYDDDERVPHNMLWMQHPLGPGFLGINATQYGFLRTCTFYSAPSEDRPALEFIGIDRYKSHDRSVVGARMVRIS